MDHFLVVTKRKKKSDTDLIKFIKCYDPREKKFRFGDRDARGITPDDVAVIFGMNNDGVELPNTDKSSKSGKEDRFMEKYFHNVERVKQKHILQAYKNHSFTEILNVTSRPGVDHFPGPLHHRSTILSVLGPDYALTVLFLGLTRELPSGSPIMGLLSRATRLTSEFPWNPKPVSSQKASR